MRAALLLAAAAAFTEEQSYTFCESNDWSSATGAWAVPWTDAARGGGCRAGTAGSNLNVLWLDASASDYRLSVLGRPEASGEAGAWAVYVRMSGYDAFNFPPCADCEASRAARAKSCLGARRGDNASGRAPRISSGTPARWTSWPARSR